VLRQELKGKEERKRICRPLPPQILPQSYPIPVDLSIGDIWWQITAEWLEIAQWSQWRAYPDLHSCQCEPSFNKWAACHHNDQRNLLANYTCLVLRVVITRNGGFQDRHEGYISRHDSQVGDRGRLGQEASGSAFLITAAGCRRSARRAGQAASHPEERYVNHCAVVCLLYM